MPNSRVYVLGRFHRDAIIALQAINSLDVILPTNYNETPWHEDADALLIRSEVKITASDISQAKRLKVVVKQGVGVDNVDLDAAKAQGVIICNTPALNSEAVAELTLSLALTVARRVCELDRRLRRGETLIRSQLLGQSLYRKSIGIIGMGNIGTAVAQKWKSAMEGDILAYDPFAPEECWLDISHQRVCVLSELLEASDVVTLHIPLTTSTRSLIGKEQFAKMRRNAILVNAARGGIVDEEALLSALRDKQLYGVALDAMNTEPPTREIYQDLLQQENVVMTPHIGASTEENQSNSGLASVETLLAVLDGKKVPNRVI